jgi:hypothetical protein
MPRTKLGRAVAKTVTKQDLEADLAEVCELAKKSSADLVKYDEATTGWNDLLDARDFAMQMGAKRAGQR